MKFMNDEWWMMGSALSKKENACVNSLSFSIDDANIFSQCWVTNYNAAIQEHSDPDIDNSY
jgi:hypothetical protein